ncbi:MAG: hypothetical protein ACOYN5_05490 [Bacteroidales bacterium]
MQDAYVQELDYTSVDSLTYSYFMSNKRTELNKTAKQAIHSGVDYYYLRMRLGMSAYNNRDFCSAEKHFSKALDFNAFDPIAQSYRMGSLLETMRAVEAGSVFNQSVSGARGFIPIRKGFRLISAHADIGMLERSDKMMNDFQSLSGLSEIYREQRIQTRSMIYDAGVLFGVRPNLVFYTGFQMIETDVSDRFAYLENQLGIDSTETYDWGTAYYYKVVSEGKLDSYSNKIKQQSVYLQSRWAPSGRLAFTFAGHIMAINQSQSYAKADSILVSDTLYYITYNDSAVMFDTYIGRIAFYDESRKSTDWSLSANARYSFGKVSSSLGTAVSHLNGELVNQFSAGVLVMPFGNADLYSQTEVSAIIDSSQTGFVFRESIGFRIAKPVWLEVGILAGDVSRFSDQNAYIVYNSLEKIRLKFESVAYFVLTPNLQLHLRYKYQITDNPYFVYNQSMEEIQELSVKNNAFTIIGGIKWIF